MKVLSYELPSSGHLKVELVRRWKHPIPSEPVSSPLNTLTGKRFPMEVVPLPSEPVVVRYGYLRGRKVASVLLFEVTQEGKRFYRNDSLILRLHVEEGTALEDIHGNDSLDLIILTDDELKEAFDSLALFKNLTGIRTAVFTVSEAFAFPGRTPYERIRNFIRYLYDRWGMRFLLIGGDRFHVPAPRIDLPSSWPSDYGDVIQTDAYYGSMDGDWNTNGNWDVGEFSDSLDLLLEVAVGRMPASDLNEALEMVRRVIYYETHYTYPFSPNAQIFASRFMVDNDACVIASDIARYLPTTLPYDTLCEMDSPPRDVGMQEFVDSVESSTILFAFSHSNYRTFIVNIDTVTVPFLIQDVVRLQTDSTPVVWIHQGCLVNSPNTNSINLLIYKEGKSIVSYGPSKESSPGSSLPIVGNGFRAAYQDSGEFFAGNIDLYAKHYAASVGYFFSFVYEALSYNLIGDPSLRIWRNVPSTISPTFTVLGDSLTVSGLPPNALLTVAKDGEVLGRWRADGSGSLSIRLPGVEGEILVGIYSLDHLPFIDTLAIGTDRVALRVEAPERVFADDTLEIAGWVKAVGSGLSDTWVRFVGLELIGDGSLYLGSIGAGDSLPFNLQVPVSYFHAEERALGYVEVSCSACDPVRDTLHFIAEGPRLEFLGGRISADSSITLVVANLSSVAARELHVTFISGSSTPTSLDTAPVVPANSTVELTVRFTNVPSGGDIFRFRLNDPSDDTLNVLLSIPDSVPLPPVVLTEPYDGYVKVMWDGMGESALVEVDTGAGWFPLTVVPANWRIVEDHYEGWQVRCYRVSLSVGGVLGDFSDRVCNRPNPPLLFEKDVPFGGYRSHLLVADLSSEPNYELIVPSVYNFVSVFSSYGELLWKYEVDTFPSLTEISAPPAVGDIDGDGEYEVVFGVAGDSPRLVVLSHDGSLKWESPLPAVPIGPVVIGLFEGNSIPDMAVKVGDHVRFYRGDGSLISDCGPFVWADEYMSAADLYGDARWELVLRGNSPGSEVVILNSDCLDSIITLPDITYVGSRVYDADADSLPEVLLNGGSAIYILDLREGSLDSVSFPILPEADVTMPLEWDGSPGWEFARLNMYDLIVADADGSVLLAHHDDVHPRGRRFVAGDVDGDGREEVFFSSGRSVLWGKTHYGDLLGFPIDLGHGDRYREEVVQGGPLLYDIDGDSTVDLCVHTSGHHLYCWSLGRSRRLSWPMVRGNRWNSGFGALEMPDTLIMELSEGGGPAPRLEVWVSGHKLHVKGRIKGRIGVKIYSVSGRLLKSWSFVARGNFDRTFHLRLPVGLYFVLTESAPLTKRIKAIVR